MKKVSFEPDNEDNRLGSIPGPIASGTERDLLSTIVIVLLLFGGLIIILAHEVSYRAQESPFAHYISNFAINIGTELIGSVLIFVIIGLAVGTVQFKSLQDIGKREIVIFLCAVGVLCFLYAYSTFESTSELETFLSGLSINFGAEIVGSLVIYLLLEQLVATLREKDETVASLLRLIKSKKSYDATKVRDSS